MNHPKGQGDAPQLDDFADVEARWPDPAAKAPRGTHYVLQSPPSPPGEPSLGNLKTASFADTLTRYHRSRSRHVLTDLEDCVFDDVQAPDWPERITSLQRHVLGMEDALDLIVGCTQIDEARLLTKTLRRTHPNTGKEPHVRALALGIVTGADHTPITTAQPYVDRYGADTVRGYMAFMGPHQNDTRFSEAHIGGVQRFLSRLSEVARDLPPHLSTQRPASAQADRELLRKTHQTIDQVTNTMESDLRLHVAIAAIMGLFSESLRARDRVQVATMRFAIENVALLLLPFAPQCAADTYLQITGEHAWEIPWPTADQAFLAMEERDIAVLVDGKVRDHLRVKWDISSDELTSLARRSSHAQQHIRGHEICREVVVPGRLVNFVTV
jgi:valyl-tRNA synthetase